MGPSYTTARPMFLPEKATTLQSPIYYPESPALPQYYPGPLSSGSDRWRTLGKMFVLKMFQRSFTFFHTDVSYSSMGPSYTTARPMFLPEKATTLQSPIYYPESPALPQYYPGPVSSGSDR